MAKKELHFQDLGDCIMCDTKLEQAPTKLGCVQVSIEKGYICYLCIEKLNAVRTAEVYEMF